MNGLAHSKGLDFPVQDFQRILPKQSVQRGAALISVMLVLSIGLMLAAQEMRQSSAAISHSKSSILATQGYWYARAGETLGRQVLFEDWRKDYTENTGNPVSDHLGEAWAQPFNSFGLEDGRLWMQIVDLQNRFNINNLRSADPASVREAEQSLLQILAAHGVSQSVFDELVLSVKQQAWVDVAQLADLRGLSVSQREDLRSVLIALPATDVALNINTVDEPLLAMLLGEKHSSIARKIVSARRLAPITDLTSPELSMFSTTSTKLGVHSEFFDIQSAAGYFSQRSYLSTKVHRAKDGSVTILARSSGKQAISADINDDNLVTMR